MDLNEVAHAYPPRSREKRTRHVGAATTATGVEPGIDLAQAADIRIGSPWCAKRLASTLANRVEHALFATILAATAYLYLGVFLKQAI
jgi:hypothetical protein